MRFIGFAALALASVPAAQPALAKLPDKAPVSPPPTVKPQVKSPSVPKITDKFKPNYAFLKLWMIVAVPPASADNEVSYEIEATACFAGYKNATLQGSTNPTAISVQIPLVTQPNLHRITRFEAERKKCQLLARVWRVKKSNGEKTLIEEVDENYFLDRPYYDNAPPPAPKSGYMGEVAYSQMKQTLAKMSETPSGHRNFVYWDNIMSKTEFTGVSAYVLAEAVDFKF